MSVQLTGLMSDGHCPSSRAVPERPAVCQSSVPSAASWGLTTGNPTRGRCVGAPGHVEPVAGHGQGQRGVAGMLQNLLNSHRASM